MSIAGNGFKMTEDTEKEKPRYLIMFMDSKTNKEKIFSSSQCEIEPEVKQ